MIQCMEKWLSVLCSLWDRVAAAFPCAQGIDGTWRQCRWMLVGFIAQFWLLISRAWCVLVPGPAACLALLTLPSHRLPRCSLEESRFVNQDCGSCAPIFGCAKACHVCHATEHSSSASQHEAEVMQTLITEGSRISSGRNFPGSTLMNFGLDDWNAYANECIHGFRRIQ